MDSRYTLQIANVSDVGYVRSHNEDSTVSDATLGILVLADGMGGHNAGEVASAVAIDNIYNDIASGLQNNGSADLEQQIEQDHCHNLLLRAIHDANLNIYNIGQENEQCLGMGTTVVVALMHNDKIHIAHVGDSRLYRIRGHDLKQITRDHSLAQELVDRGLFSEEEALKNVPRNLITRALGLDKKTQVDITEKQIATGDIYLLCSDGLTDMVKDEEIHLTLGKYSANLAHAANELVRIANGYGGNDNISVILVKVLDAVATC